MANAKRTAAKAAAEKATTTTVTEGKTASPAVKTKEAPVKKDTAVKKTEAKKAEPKANVTVEFQGRSFVAKEILEKAKKEFAKNNKGVEIKTIDIYMKPEESVAYYVVNGVGSDDYKVTL